jgi:hypothetical protein
MVVVANTSRRPRELLGVPVAKPKAKAQAQAGQEHEACREVLASLLAWVHTECPRLCFGDAGTMAVVLSLLSPLKLPQLRELALHPGKSRGSFE